MSAADQTYSTAAFALVIYLVAKGYTPLRASITGDGTGRVLYTFSPAARDEVEQFYQTKDRLNLMAVEARTVALGARR